MTLTASRTTHIAGELRDVNKWYGDHHVLTDISVRPWQTYYDLVWARKRS